MTPTQLETRLIEAMREARAQGFVVVRGAFRGPRSCCAFGALDLGPNWADFEVLAWKAGVSLVDALAVVSRLWEFAKSQGWTEPLGVVQ